MSKVVGLDLGTGNSCISVFEGSTPTIIINSEGKRTTPSVIGFTQDGEMKVGDAAKRQAITNPKNTVHSIKRFMGNTYEESRDEADRVQYKVVNEGGFPKVDINGRKYTPQELSAMIIQKMKKTAEEYLGEDVKDIVITVPAYFNDSQRQATKEAGQIAGLEVKRIINEPTAAALAYGVNKSDKDETVVVYDVGQGTADCSVLSFGGGVFEVITTNGDTHLGGNDFDQRIIDWLVDNFKKDEGVDLSKDPMAMQRLKEAAEKAKIELSTAPNTEINIPYITSTNEGPKHLAVELTRAKFEQLTSDLLDKLHDLCVKALELSKLSKSDIDEVILVGGSTRIPSVAKVAKDVFGIEPSHGVNPDEAVAMGAAIQGAILNRENGVDDIVLLDINPLDLSIETAGGVATKMIEAGTTVPCSKEETFTTYSDNQTAVTIHVVQGNRPMASQNKSLGQFNLEGILPAPKGTPKITVKFDMDANSILTVTAKDAATGKEQKIRIEGNSGLSKEDIERMKKEAEANATADKKLREEADAVNRAESTVFQQRKMLDGVKDKVKEEDRNKLEALFKQLEEAAAKRDVSEITRLEGEINTAWTKVSSELYGANPGSNPFNFANGNIFDMFGGINPNGGMSAGASGGKTQTPPPTTDEPDDVKDADFEEVK